MIVYLFASQQNSYQRAKRTFLTRAPRSGVLIGAQSTLKIVLVSRNYTFSSILIERSSFQHAHIGNTLQLRLSRHVRIRQTSVQRYQDLPTHAFRSGP